MSRGWFIALCWVLGLLLVVARMSDVAAQEWVALHCARGVVTDYPDARLVVEDSGVRVVHVTFVGFRPSRSRAEWSLRDCLRTAAKYDDSRDIVAMLWYREPQLRSPREPLGVFGSEKKLVYSAASGRIVLRAAAAARP